MLTCDLTSAPVAPPPGQTSAESHDGLAGPYCSGRGPVKPLFKGCFSFERAAGVNPRANRSRPAPTPKADPHFISPLCHSSSGRRGGGDLCVCRHNAANQLAASGASCPSVLTSHLLSAGFRETSSSALKPSLVPEDSSVFSSLLQVLKQVHVF